MAILGLALAITIGLTLYLLCAGRWGRKIKEQNYPVVPKCICGLFMGLIPLVCALYFGYGSYRSQGFPFLFLMAFFVAVSGFIAVVSPSRRRAEMPK